MSNTNSFNRILERIHVAISLFMVIITGFSFCVGLYLVFLTNLGTEASWYENVPLDFLLFGIFGLPSIYLNLGLIFIFFWLVYLACYLFCFLKPMPFNKILLLKKNSLLSHTNSEIKQNKWFDKSSNYLMITISWFSAYFVISILIDVIQQLFGVTLGNPLTNDPILSFFYLTAAPLNEEIFFRVILMGLPLFLLFVPLGKGKFLSTINHPYPIIHPYKTKNTKIGIIIIIILNSILFGISHVIFGGGYEIGKISQAAMGGLIIAWIYYRYGLPSAITFHWISNYVFFAYSILGFYLFQTPWDKESDNVLLGVVSIGFIIIGILFLCQMGSKVLKKLIIK